MISSEKPNIENYTCKIEPTNESFLLNFMFLNLIFWKDIKVIGFKDKYH